MNQTVDETRHTRGLAKLAELDGQDGDAGVVTVLSLDNFRETQCEEGL
jgi:hypothetical protein